MTSSSPKLPLKGLTSKYHEYMYLGIKFPTHRLQGDPLKSQQTHIFKGAHTAEDSLML